MQEQTSIRLSVFQNRGAGFQPAMHNGRLEACPTVLKQLLTSFREAAVPSYPGIPGIP
jgi:hypothetical protein